MWIRIIDFPESILWAEEINNQSIEESIVWWIVILTSTSRSPFSLSISSACPFLPRFPWSSRYLSMVRIVSSALRNGHEMANLLCRSRRTRQIGHGQSPWRPRISAIMHLIEDISIEVNAIILYLLIKLTVPHNQTIQQQQMETDHESFHHHISSGIHNVSSPWYFPVFSGKIHAIQHV